MTDRDTPQPPPRSFDAALSESGLHPLTATGIEVLQINFGRLCNQACLHCHVEAGPNRTEMIGDGTLDQCLRVLRAADIPTVEIGRPSPRRGRTIGPRARPARRASSVPG